MPDFHSPPARKGIYAFVQGFEEKFLLSSSEFRPHRMEWVKDKNGNKINHLHPDFDHLFDKYFCRYDKERPDDENHFDFQFLCKNKKRKLFVYQGDIWHHLNSIPYLYKEEKGSWYLSSFDDYVELLKKEMHVRSMQKRKHGVGFCIDYLEIFIEI